jgi:hypothetical protein
MLEAVVLTLVSGTIGILVRSCISTLMRTLCRRLPAV